MITSNNEFGAPWNDQFYDVTYILELDVEGLIFTSNPDTIIITLPGPKKYDTSEISKYAIDRIQELYKGKFEIDTPRILITKIK